MKYQVLFSLKNNKKVFINVVCCNESLTNAKAELLFVFSGSFYSCLLLCLLICMLLKRSRGRVVRAARVWYRKSP